MENLGRNCILAIAAGLLAMAIVVMLHPSFTAHVQPVQKLEKTSPGHSVGYGWSEPLPLLRMPDWTPAPPAQLLVYACGPPVPMASEITQEPFFGFQLSLLPRAKDYEFIVLIPIVRMVPCLEADNRSRTPGAVFLTL